MSKKDKDIADAFTSSDTQPPPAALPAPITITDESGCLEALRAVGVTATKDISPGVVVTLDKPERVFAGDKIVFDAPGRWHVEKLSA